MSIQKYIHYQPVLLESGAILPQVEIAYHTYGELNAAGDNVIWVCHIFGAGIHNMALIVLG